MTTESVQAAIDRVGNAVDVLRNLPGRAYSHGFVDAQFTNWQSEARAWRESCAFLDQSHHMTDLYLSGPDAQALLTHLGVNSFASFGPGKAKQFVAVGPDGRYIGDAILFGLEQNLLDLVGRRTVLDWVEFNATTGGWDVAVERDLPSLQRGGRPPKVYRYEVQGPAAGAVMEKVTAAALPDVKFFSMTYFEIAGCRVRALRHGMAGEVGFELFGPWEQGTAVREAILAAGEEFGMLRAGSIAYSTSNLESGWIPGPVPAIFSGEAMRAYREWLPVSAAGVLAGSLYTGDITDYYVTPYDLGYGRHVRFDHDFVGAEQLRQRADGPRRQKVTLVWDPDDVARVVASAWTPGPRYKHLDIPKARYGTFQMDEVLAGGERAGISMDCGYIVNDRAVVSLAVVDEAVAAPGTRVSVVWGESPNSAKPQVEPHEQTRIRATVAPAPYKAHARTAYRSNVAANA